MQCCVCIYMDHEDRKSEVLCVCVCACGPQEDRTMHPTLEVHKKNTTQTTRM